MRVALDNRLRDRLDRAARLNGRIARSRILARSVRRNQGHVSLLGVSHRIADCNVLIAADINHRILLHQTGIVFQSHEVRRRVAHIDENREGCLVTEVLHLAFRRLYGRVLGCAGHGIEVALGRALVHQHEADNGVVARGRSNARVHPNVVIFCDVVVTERAVGAGSGLDDAVLAEPAIDPSVLVLAGPVVLLDEQIRRVYAVDPFGNFGNIEVLAFAR